MPELTEAQRRSLEVMDKLWGDPETRPLVEEALVKKYPEAEGTLPHRVLEKKFQAEAAKLQAATEKFEQERATDRADRNRTAARREIMEDPTLAIGADEIEEVEKLMMDPTIGPIGSHRAAAELYRGRQRVATPRAPFDFNADVPGLRGAGGDEFKGIVENPDEWARRKTGEILTDFARGNGAKWQ